MPAPLRIVLSEAEDSMLSELRVATTVPQRTRDRAHMLRLNAQGWNVPAIAKMFECHEHTVRATIKRWKAGGLSGLWEAPGRGAKKRWTEADIAYIETCLKEENRTYNSVQLSRILREERSVHISSDRLREILKKKNYRWKRTRQSQRQKQDPIKRRTTKADLEILELAAAKGEIQLKYLDESGFCLWSPVSYSYSLAGEQKRMEQTKIVHGKRISILGLWEPGRGFEYGLIQGGFNSRRYVELMDWVADTAEKTLKETGQVTVIVQDNGSLHKSKLTQSQWKRWEEKGLVMFFLAPYCSEMNRIEGEWNKLKAHEIAGRMFDNAYDLAMAVEAGVENRYQANGYNVSRFIFNCA